MKMISVLSSEQNKDMDFFLVHPSFNSSFESNYQRMSNPLALDKAKDLHTDL